MRKNMRVNTTKTSSNNLGNDVEQEISQSYWPILIDFDSLVFVRYQDQKIGIMSWEHNL